MDDKGARDEFFRIGVSLHFLESRTTSMRVAAFFSFLVWFLSGEWMLRWLSNGGTAVLLRSMWSSAWLYCAAIALLEITKPGVRFEFDAAALRAAVNDTVPWAGAIFGAVYAALYARFASQWRYMADLYNQIMAAQVGCSPLTRQSRRLIAIWKAAYIEDLEELHLITKPMYAQLAADMLRSAQVRREFRSGTIGGRGRLISLERRIGPIIARERTRLAKRYRRTR